VLRLDGRYWLVERAEPAGEAGKERVIATPARYRVRLRHPDGREELGAFRRFRADGPRLGHAFTSLEDGQPVSWQIVDERLSHDEDGEAYLDLLAERTSPSSRLFPTTSSSMRSPGPGRTSRESHKPRSTVLSRQGSRWSWPLSSPERSRTGRRQSATSTPSSLDEIEDDLFELCGVDLRTRRETWLATVKERLRSDLERFRADIEGDHDQIEEWDFLDGRIFASVGSPDDEADRDSGHGWMCRLLDSGALAAAGFARVRKAELVV
jgi:hypothetical protein